ncbi:hypothetical protein [Candidatus Leptofilum sp.]|uniref:hypothetical protein n=1 Tax=Candidatus Leptofilum sp. TaxID=3241576 RepID=UPI003B5AA138
MLNKNNLIRTWLIIGLLFAGLVLVACSGTGGTEPATDDDFMESMDDEDMDAMEHDDMDDMDHDDEHDDHDDHPNRVPNEGGAAISITSPEAGTTFSTLDQVLVEVEVENFALGEDGNHWHVYVDGVSFGMVMGNNTDQALPGLEPGEHEISVFMSISTHEEYEDGDSVTIIVEE